jgi:hypothetical protein
LSGCAFQLKLASPVSSSFCGLGYSYAQVTILFHSLKRLE